MFKEGTVAFKAEHLFQMAIEEENAEYMKMVETGLAKRLESSNSVTFFNHGKPTVCGGITEYWDGRGQLWAAFSKNTRYNFVPTFRAVKRWVHWQLRYNYRRIELSIDCDFPIGRRRAEMLGFSLECELAKKYLPNGKDCSLYSLVRGD